MRFEFLRAATAVAMILTPVAGCDNVSWGGADVTVVPPPRREAPAAGERPTQVVRTVAELPDGPVLFHVRREGEGGRLEPLAEILRDSLNPLQPGQNANAYADGFIAEHMREGAEFVLYHNGGRVGTFVAQSAAFDGGTPCRPLPSAQGVLELGPAGQRADGFIALARQHALPDVGRPAAPEVTRNMQVLGPILAERMMRSRGASLPANWERAFAQVTPIPIEDAQNDAFAATFVVGDTLGPGLDDEGYALFFIAEPSEASYDTVYVNYRPYSEGGKQAPSVLEWLDWNRDGQPELLLRVFGTSDTWFEALGREDRGRWRRTFEDRCNLPDSGADTALPLPAPPPAPLVPPDTMS